MAMRKSCIVSFRERSGGAVTHVNTIPRSRLTTSHGTSGKFIGETTTMMTPSSSRAKSKVEIKKGFKMAPRIETCFEEECRRNKYNPGPAAYDPFRTSISNIGFTISNGSRNNKQTLKISTSCLSKD